MTNRPCLTYTCLIEVLVYSISLQVCFWFHVLMLIGSVENNWDQHLTVLRDQTRVRNWPAEVPSESTPFNHVKLRILCYSAQFFVAGVTVWGRDCQLTQQCNVALYVYADLPSLLARTSILIDQKIHLIGCHDSNKMQNSKVLTQVNLLCLRYRHKQ